MKQFYSGMADFLKMMVDQSLRDCGEYQCPIGSQTERDRETYNIAYNNGFINAMKRINEWLNIAIKPEED